MKKIIPHVKIVIIIALCFSQISSAQTIAQSVVGASGENQVSQSGKTLNFTVGEIAVDFYQSNSSLSQGFHQLYETIVDIDAIKENDSNINIFPNPTTGSLVLTTENDFTFKILVYDILGSIQLESASKENTTSIDISDFPQGLYYISIYHKNEMIKTFKISKI